MTRVYRFNDPWTDSKGITREETVHMTEEVVLSTYRPHYDKMAKKLNRPPLTDEELLSEVEITGWAEIVIID